MKWFTVVLLGVLPSLTLAARDLGHESGGRLAINTVYVRFSSRGAGINSKAFEAVQSLIKMEADAGHLYETQSRPWGREGERDVCVRMKNGRLRFTIALDRVVRLLHAENEVGWQAGPGSCAYWPTEHYNGQDTAYMADTRPEAKQVSLDCVNAETLPDDYHYHLALFETLDANKQPQVAYTLTQSSRSARYRPLSGTVEKTALGFVDGVVSFQYGFEGELVTVQPTAQDAKTGTLYLGSATRDGGAPLRLTCVSGRPQGPIR